MKNKAFQFIKYINKVYRFRQFLSSLHDGRINPSIRNDWVIAVIFVGIVTWMGSFNHMEQKLHQGYFDKILGPKMRKGSAETFGNVLEASCVEQLRHYNQLIIKVARYNKAMQHGTIDGFLVAALDGTETTRTTSPQRGCDCCKTSVYTSADGATVEQKHENFVGASYIGKPPNLDSS